jgi:hypothetical protein
MASPINVAVEVLAGDTLQLSLDASGTVDDVKVAVASSCKLHPNSCQLLVGTNVTVGPTKLSDLALDDAGKLSMQLVQVDPMLSLGRFDFNRSFHAGLQVVNSRAECKFSRVAKTPLYPDSSSANVLVRQPIRETCYVEFKVVNSGGQMSFGVTHKPQEVMEACGIANRSLRCTWIYSKQTHASWAPVRPGPPHVQMSNSERIYSKQSKAMPTWLFGGVPIRSSEDKGFRHGDLVAVTVYPERRQIKFYRNGDLVCDNLPNRPLPELGEDDYLRMYAMVDAPNDEIWIHRFGPGEAYPEPPPVKPLDADAKDVEVAQGTDQAVSGPSAASVPPLLQPLNPETASMQIPCVQACCQTTASPES